MKKFFWGHEVERLLSSTENSEVAGRVMEAEQQQAGKGAIKDFTLRFDDVLDPSKAKSSLERVLQREEWRLLGAGLRTNTSKDTRKDSAIVEMHGGLEMMFLETRYDPCIEDHPVASQLPTAMSVPTISGPTSPELQDFLRHPEYPKTIEEWLQSPNIPGLAIRLSLFQNATLLTLSYPPTLLDTHRLSALLKTWTSESLSSTATPHPENIHTELHLPEPLSPLPPPKEPHVLTNKLLSTTSTLLHILLTSLSHILHPQHSTRTILLPARFAHRLRLQARRDLDNHHQYHTTFEKPPFISDNDLLLSFLAHLTLSTSGVAPTRPVTIINTSHAVDVPTYTFVPSVQALVAQPLGVTAKNIRDNLSAQRRPGQVEGMWRMREGRRGGVVVFGEGWDFVGVGGENLHKEKFFDLDFSAVVVGQKNKEDETAALRRGRPTGIFVNGRQPLRNMGSFLGRDAEGNWWISRTLRNDVWPLVEKKLNDMVKDKAG